MSNLLSNENDSDLERERTYRAAEMYYSDKHGQKYIADTLGVSQTTVSRLLKDAERFGILEIIINYPYPVRQGRSLKEHLPKIVKKVVVASNSDGINGKGKNTKKLGRKGARHLLGLILKSNKEIISICISCGNTMKALIDQLASLIEYNSNSDHIRKLKQKTIVLHPTVVQVDFKVSKTSPSYLVTYFVEKMQNHFLAIEAYTPMVPKLFLKTYFTQLKWDDFYSNALRNTPDICIFGIGLLNDENFKNVKDHFIVPLSKGDLENGIEISHFPLDQKGEAIKVYLPNIIGLEIKQLRKLAESDECHVIAVAGSQQKAKAMFSCLKNPCFDTLITDSPVAEYALERFNSIENKE